MLGPLCKMDQLLGTRFQNGIKNSSPLPADCPAGNVTFFMTLCTQDTGNGQPIRFRLAARQARYNRLVRRVFRIVWPGVLSCLHAFCFVFLFV
jgi:hypothetical protein